MMQFNPLLIDLSEKQGDIDALFSHFSALNISNMHFQLVFDSLILHNIHTMTQNTLNNLDWLNKRVNVDDIVEVKLKLSRLAANTICFSHNLVSSVSNR